MEVTEYMSNTRTWNGFNGATACLNNNKIKKKKQFTK